VTGFLEELKLCLIVACDGVGTSKIWMLAIGSEIQKEISDI
jgi:hypothetical protein